jgi:hypothetical protein
MYAVYVGLNQWAVQRLKGLWEKLPTKWEKRYARHRPTLQFQVELAAMRARLRCEHEWAWLAFDDAAPAQLEQEAPRGRRASLRASPPAWRVLFRAAPRRDRPLPLARTRVVDDAQLTALSNRQRAEQLGGRQRRRL